MPAAAGLALQVAKVMACELGRPEAARGHYARAAELQRTSPTTYLHCLGHVAHGKIDAGKPSSPPLTFFRRRQLL